MSFPIQGYNGKGIAAQGGSISKKKWMLGSYKVEADAAAARDVVANILGYPLNFKKPRKITGQRSKGAETAVADAIKAANAFVLGDSTLGLFWHARHQSLTLYPALCPDNPS